MFLKRHSLTILFHFIFSYLVKYDLDSYFESHPRVLDKKQMFKTEYYLTKT